ncbi:MAG TPA: DUF1698 domain-containing protein [Solirubrobacteraceae bacterium]|jgi:tRNA (mo5U34)-methyltransferase|nr:DUF1698 domain-containing protein [Solirubrobacteraceae bacterium]
MSERVVDDPATIAERVRAHRWFHSIDLGNGIVTPGVDESAKKLVALDLPADLRGRTVLDVGSWDGFFAFEAERRGASRVMATDSYSWDGPGWGDKTGFELVREVLGARVEDKNIDVLELSPEAVGEWDVVLCLGVLYHMRDPMLMLERVASVTHDLLVLETLVDMTFTRRPAAAFYADAEYVGDTTNWWGPNTPAVLAMLRASGFERLRVVTPQRLASRAGRVAYNVGNVAHSRLARARDALPLSYVASDRLVVHANRGAL